MKTLNEKFQPYFAGIIGQEKAIENIGLVLNSVDAGEDSAPILLRGDSGLGKTHMQEAIENSYSAMGWHIIHIDCPTQMVGEKFAQTCQEIREALCPILISVDESHRLPAGRVSVKRFHKFIQLITDEKLVGKSISINDGELSVSCLNRKQITVVLATNFASKLEEGKGSTSFRGRFCDILLESYTRKQSDSILDLMIHKKNLRVADGTRAIMAACARGNARPLAMITGKLASMAAGLHKTTLNKEDCLNAIRLSDLFPAGLSISEVDIMLRVQKVPTAQNVMLTLFPNVDVSALRNSLAYLQGKDFVRMSKGQGYVLTPIGERYLQDCVKAGFKLERE